MNKTKINMILVCAMLITCLVPGAGENSLLLGAVLLVLETALVIFALYHSLKHHLLNKAVSVVGFVLWMSVNIKILADILT